MSKPRHIGVIDIGKTNAKLAVVDLGTMREIGVLTRPNTVLPGPPWPHFDIEGIWAFLLDAFAQLHRAHRIDAISITAHGASIVLLDKDGGLAAPMLDYEFDGPDTVAAAYDAIRPDFAQTGSPRMKLGLNFGAMLHYQFHTDPGLRDRVALVIPYPQYWAFRLTGIAASELTSLACHGDFWNPREACFSTLVAALGLTGRVAPIRRANELLGPILPQIAARTGLPAETQVACGIHDSNASLYPHLLTRSAPFSVVSTGTWVVVLSVGGHAVVLDPARDTLINVNALGDPVASAKFMGGRTFDVIMAGHDRTATPQDAAAVLERGVMLLPSVEPLSGPYPGRRHHWSHPEPDIPDGQRFIALSWHLALMTAVCLEISGAEGPALTEGPFARNAPYLAMLEAATGRAVVAATGASTGTSLGAALLVDASTLPPARPIPAPNPDPALVAYAAAWRRVVDGAQCQDS